MLLFILPAIGKSASTRLRIVERNVKMWKSLLSGDTKTFSRRLDFFLRYTFVYSITEHKRVQWPLI